MHADVPTDDRYVNYNACAEKGPHGVCYSEKPVMPTEVSFLGERMSECSGSESPHKIFYFIFHT